MPSALVRLSAAVAAALSIASLLWAAQSRANPPAPPIDGPDGFVGMPATLSWKDTSPAWKAGGETLVLTGTIYQPDARTPAAGVVLYYYHTNAEGRYVHVPSEPRSMAPNELGQTHGAIRGWVRTGADGRYEITTIRPGVYPTRDEPAHVHATIKEPDRAEYYIDDFVFDDDPLLTSAKRGRLENRCGSGVLRLVKRQGVLIGERDIILGQNVPGHPGAKASEGRSGRKIGEDVPSFTPTHVWGPDKGSRACPVCKYGWYHGVLLFVRGEPAWDEVRSWLAFLERESTSRADRLKVYFVFEGGERHRAELEKLGAELSIRRVALTTVPTFADTESDVALQRIDPAVRTTLILYRRSKVVDKAIDLAPNEEGFRWLTGRLDATKNEFFDLPK